MKFIGSFAFSLLPATVLFLAGCSQNHMPQPGTVKDEAAGGMAKLATTGGVVSGRVIVTDALKLFDTFPAASFVHA